MRTWLVALLVLVAGCAEDTEDDPGPSDGDADGDGYPDAVEEEFQSDPYNATSTPAVMRQENVTYSNTVQVIGTGVPTVQCPADQVNSQVMTWTVTAETGDAGEAWVTDLTFSVAGTMTVNDVDLFVTGPNGNALGSGTSGANTETVTVGGRQPLGDYTIEARGCSGAGDATVTASGTVQWIASAEELLADG